MLFYYCITNRIYLIYDVLLYSLIISLETYTLLEYIETGSTGHAKH